MLPPAARCRRGSFPAAAHSLTGRQTGPRRPWLSRQKKSRAGKLAAEGGGAAKRTGGRGAAGGEERGAGGGRPAGPVFLGRAPPVVPRRRAHGRLSPPRWGTARRGEGGCPPGPRGCSPAPSPGEVGEMRPRRPDPIGMGPGSPSPCPPTRAAQLGGCRGSRGRCGACCRMRSPLLGGVSPPAERPPAPSGQQQRAQQPSGSRKCPRLFAEMQTVSGFGGG